MSRQEQPAAPRQRPVLSQFVFFVGIGLIGTGLYFGLYNVRRFWSGPMTSNAFAVTVSMLFSFVANRRVTFGYAGEPNRAAPTWWQLTSFTVVFGATLGLSSALLALGVLVVGITSRLGENAVIAVAAGGSFLVRFMLLRGWVFRARRSVEHGERSLR